MHGFLLALPPIAAAYTMACSRAALPSASWHASGAYAGFHRGGSLQLAEFAAPKSSSAQQLLFQDSKKSQTARAQREREMIRPNTKEMTEPPKRAIPTTRNNDKKKKSAVSGGGGGFGKQAAPALTAAQQLQRRRMEVMDDDGVLLVPGVLSKDTIGPLYACIKDELSRAYVNVDSNPESCLGHFNVPVETFDPLRGYLLLPLRDEASVEAAVDAGPLVTALRELLAPGSPLGDLYANTCGGSNAELYDLVALRTEPGAARQPIHSDTPYQKTPALFCAFIALHDVTYEMGSTVFLPGTHRGCKGAREAFDNGQFDGRRDEMLSKAPSRYTMLKAGDAAFFNMNTLHAGTANYVAEEGGSQRLLLILTFRNRKAKQELGHLPNLRPHYRDRGITLDDMRRELDKDTPFGGVHERDGCAFGDGLRAPQTAH